MNEGVARVCKCVDLDENTVRNWGTMADLSRITGLGGQWAELPGEKRVTRFLEEAGKLKPVLPNRD